MSWRRAVSMPMQSRSRCGKNDRITIQAASLAIIDSIHDRVEKVSSR